MDDFIKRQDAIDTHCAICPDKDKCPDGDFICPDRELFRMIKAEVPDTKIGKWIKNGNTCVCPFCGTGFTTASEEVRTAHKFCFYCGAKMEVDDDGEADGDGDF